MALVNSAFSVNVTPGAMPPVVHVSEYDVGRTYTVTINGQNGSAFNIPTGTTATVEGTLNGSVGFTQSATISNNQVSFALSESMTAYSGKAWCKIKLTLNDEPIQTCAFVLAVDRAGVEAETVIGADGFEQQIVNAVNDWLDEHPPASGGMSEAFKQALLDCFENVAWINDQGQDYYDALYAALYPPKTLVSISAAFNQGSAVIYDTDSLDTLKQYLTVTATYDDTSTGVVTNYTLSGTLTVGTSTITVLYNGKTTTFNVTVSEAPRLPAQYQEVAYIESDGNQFIDTNVAPNDIYMKIQLGYYKASQAASSGALIGVDGASKPPFSINLSTSENTISARSQDWFSITDSFVYGHNNDVEVVLQNDSPTGKITFVSGNVTKTNEKTTANADFSSSTLNLFHYGRSFGKLAARIMYCKVYNSSGKILDLIPCYKKSNGAIGMYDTVSGTFFTNTGTGTFTKGADV